MGCSCEVDVYDYDYEPVELWRRASRKANKNHKCHECGREIVKGEKYEHVSYMHDGRFYADKTCADCLSAIGQFYPKGGYCTGLLWDEIRNHIVEWREDVPEDCIIELTPLAKSKVCDLIEEVTL